MTMNNTQFDDLQQLKQTRTSLISPSQLISENKYNQ